MELIMVLLAVAGLFIWNRAEASADIRALDSKIDSLQKMVYDEMKDFHNRLCDLEEERNK
jgi:hypothetical protein|uniref:Uncharacterized protein n=1 Tax=uncultured Caudovirales phage TaxID=2100421 RepID=A0A6J5KZK1_9CAUD|nr:hypothetical protein UFOVP88_36 [uncultured Caudovirales phage]